MSSFETCLNLPEIVDIDWCWHLLFCGCCQNIKHIEIWSFRRLRDFFKLEWFIHDSFQFSIWKVVWCCKFHNFFWRSPKGLIRWSWHLSLFFWRRIHIFYDLTLVVCLLRDGSKIYSWCQNVTKILDARKKKTNEIKFQLFIHVKNYFILYLLCWESFRFFEALINFFQNICCTVRLGKKYSLHSKIVGVTFVHFLSNCSLLFHLHLHKT